MPFGFIIDKTKDKNGYFWPLIYLLSFSLILIVDSIFIHYFDENDCKILNYPASLEKIS